MTSSSQWSGGAWSGNMILSMAMLQSRCQFLCLGNHVTQQAEPHLPELGVRHIDP
jgi:hypothetical protein